MEKTLFSYSMAMLQDTLEQNCFLVVSSREDLPSLYSVAFCYVYKYQINMVWQYTIKFLEADALGSLVRILRLTFSPRFMSAV